MVYRVVIAVAGGALIGMPAVRRWLNGPPTGKKKKQIDDYASHICCGGFTKTIFAASSIAAALARLYGVYSHRSTTHDTRYYCGYLRDAPSLSFVIVTK